MVDETRISPECPEIPPAVELPQSHLELRKQISVFVPLSEYRVIRQRAAELRIPMAELVRRWIRPELKELRRVGFHEHQLCLRGDPLHVSEDDDA